jgi:hypothetical protein
MTGTLDLRRLAPLVLTAVVLLVAMLTVTPWPVGVFEDDAIYAVLAKALATGEGYRMINLPGAPHATHFPPGYPFFLSLLWRIAPSFPENVVVFKFANAALLSLASLGAYRFGRSPLGLSPLVAAGVAMAGTLSLAVLLVTGVVLSEPLFMALLLPALLLAERSAEEGEVRLAVLAGLLVGAAALVRTIGAVAIPAALVVLLFRRRVLPAVAFAMASALFLVPWQLWLAAYQHEVPPVLMGKYGAYGPWLAAGYREGGVDYALSLAARSLKDLQFLIGYFFLPFLRWPALNLASCIAAVALMVGGLFSTRRRMPVTAVFLALYGLVVVFWPYVPDRFVLPLWPLLMFALWSAGHALWRWAPIAGRGRIARTAALALLAVVLAGHAWYNVRGYRGEWWASVQRDSGRKAKPLVEWVARNTALNDVVSTEHDLIVYLYTGRRAVPISTFLARERTRPLTQDEIAYWVETVIDTYQPRFYMTSWDMALRAADGMARRVPPELRLAGRFSDTWIFERIGPRIEP